MPLFKFLFVLSVGLVFANIACAKVDLVVVEKSKERLVFLDAGRVVKEYTVVFGANPVGHKQQEGDERTPEGAYVLDYKKSDSAFYKSIHISYPNEADQLRAEDLGVAPGGFIMIHGQRNGLSWLSRLTQLFNWTDGCIAVTNAEMDEIWQLVEKGTAIEIKP